MIGTLKRMVVLMAFAALGAGAQAGELAQPKNKVILEVTGAITNTNTAGAARFDLAMLEAIGGAKLQTSCPWLDGRPEFEGVSMKRLLEHVGAKGSTIVVIALNDYKVEIPISDFENYPVVMAYRLHGKTLPVRAKGPLWIIYPQDQHPELKTKEIQSRWVWQIKELHIR